MNDPIIENGMAKVAPGEYLCGAAQPVAFFGEARTRGLGGFIAPDRGSVWCVKTTGEAYFGSSENPFLTALTILPEVMTSVVSKKILVATAEARVKGKSLKVIPMSFSRAIPVTLMEQGWAVFATKSRVTRVVLKEDETLTVRPDAVVAWVGKDPSAFCPKLKVMDILLPRGPRNLFLSFHGECTVWFEGAEVPKRRLRGIRA